jgi:hypothetical protein
LGRRANWCHLVFAATSPGPWYNLAVIPLVESKIEQGKPCTKSP